MAHLKNPPCDEPLWSAKTDDELREATLAELRRLNVFGVLSGTLKSVSTWRQAAPGRFVPGFGFQIGRGHPSPEVLRDLFQRGDLAVLAEVTNQYAGLAPDDVRMEPYWALAEELDMPVGIHIGPGPPGVIYLGAQGYRAELHSALTLEPVLVKHPGLRVYVMHAGFPMLDDTLALLYAHPQVYVGVGIISYGQPRAAFYRFLKGLVDGGFSKRILFGSDQMVWPGAIGAAIEAIESAPFLTAEQKRDVLYNNAARFFRFTEEERARHVSGAE